MGRFGDDRYLKWIQYPNARAKVNTSINNLFDEDEFVISMMGEETLIKNIIMGIKLVGFKVDSKPKVKRYKDRLEIYNKDNTMIEVTRDTIRTKHLK